jgi:rsbT co-antagonist protein RsbR
MGALSQGQPVVRYTNRYRHKNGHYLLLEWDAKVETEESGLIYAVARDVPQRPGSRPGTLSCD